MRTACFITVLACSAVCAYGQAGVFEPFRHTVGVPLGGSVDQTTPGQFALTGQQWFMGGNNNATPANEQDAKIGSESLTITGLTPGSGNSVILSNAAAGSAVVDRIKPGSSTTVASGTLYYSLILKVENITGLLGRSGAAAGAFIGGFNNLLPVAGNNASLSRACARLQLAADPMNAGKFNVGIRSDSATGAVSPVAWDPTPRTVNDVIFIVAAYQFNPGTNDDVSMIWINPDSSTFAAASPPAVSANCVTDSANSVIVPCTSTGSDISQLQIQSFFLRQNTGAGINVVDEVRIGASWADVTPTGAVGGACCVRTGFGIGTCSIQSQVDCQAQANSTYNGDGTGCAANSCNFCPTIKFDSDFDGDVDMDDFGAFQRCWQKPASTPGCLCFDKENTGTIGAADFADFVACAPVASHGANTPPSGACN